MVLLSQVALAARDYTRSALRRAGRRGRPAALDLRPLQRGWGRTDSPREAPGGPLAHVLGIESTHAPCASWRARGIAADDIPPDFQNTPEVLLPTPAVTILHFLLHELRNHEAKTGNGATVDDQGPEDREPSLGFTPGFIPQKGTPAKNARLLAFPDACR